MTQTSERVTVARGSTVPKPAGFKPSAEHAKYELLLEPWFKRVEQQEARFIKAGFPAEGMTAFLRRWVGAWNTQDLDLLVDCTTPDMEFVDSAAGHRHGHKAMHDYTYAAFVNMPDLAFYPQDDTVTSLPYWDHSDGVWRVTFPWRGIGRNAGPLTSPDGEFPDFPPAYKNVNWVGIDRYVLTDDWKIARIDCDWDVLGVLQQFGFPALGSRSVRAAAVVMRGLAPLMRFRSRRDA